MIDAMICGGRSTIISSLRKITIAEKNQRDKNERELLEVVAVCDSVCLSIIEKDKENTIFCLGSRQITTFIT